MKLEIEGKTALVTAASRGMGKSIATKLSMSGVNIIICSRNEDTLEKTANEIMNETEGKVVYVKADVSKYDDIKKLILLGEKKFGGIDILVNNAGGPPSGTFSDFSEDQWMETWNQNFLSVKRLSESVIPYMKTKRWGRIINIVSTTVKEVSDVLILSNTVRMAVIGFSKTISRQVASDGITVNNILPGAIFTDRWKQLAEDTAKRENISSEDVLKNSAMNIPMGRYGSPAEVADLALFLASERANYITGTSIQIDGGLLKTVY